ncbi:hypothetical protein H3V53_42650 [Paraburkholderia bengalensis]|uniref:Uncharacterized protein n=1 Tax=Paraburkholderia bengalensis TaxID=2747562 RepID=A0ABU8J705_9BURK
MSIATAMRRAVGHPQQFCKRPGFMACRSDASETTRRACLRAIQAVATYDPTRKHDLSLWYAVRHTDRDDALRMLMLNRRA